jgi:hypothetical protein
MNHDIAYRKLTGYLFCNWNWSKTNWSLDAGDCTLDLDPRPWLLKAQGRSVFGLGVWLGPWRHLTILALAWVLEGEESVLFSLALSSSAPFELDTKYEFEYMYFVLGKELRTHARAKFQPSVPQSLSYILRHRSSHKFKSGEKRGRETRSVGRRVR